MQKRVFHIDQECYIIFAEDLSSKKERFLRVGNSDFLKEFGESLTFITLLSPLFPGNPFKELEIFRPDIDRKVVGLKNVVGKFLDFLKTANINLNKVEPIYAEDQTLKDGMNRKEKLTEEEFLRKIRPDSKMVKHSFASFYSDGNVRIFNKKELIFDLKNMLLKTLNESLEMRKLAEYYKKYYEASYQKSGIIHSGKSVFVFSNNNFACISDSQKWVKDAIRVGIDPSSIDFLYITENIEPDSLWIKSFLKKRSDDKRIRLVLKEKNPLWIKLLPEELYIPVYPEKDSIELEIGELKLFFQNNRINVFSDSMKLTFIGEKGFLDRGRTIGGEMLAESEKLKFDLVIDNYAKDAFTLFSYNPLIFAKHVTGNNYIGGFFDNVSGFDVDHCSFPVLSDDEDYEKNIVPDENEKTDFLTKMFFENFRRLNVENCPEVTDEIYQKFAEYLSGFSGNVINSNRIVMEQVFGMDPDKGMPVMRNTISENSFFIFGEGSDPYGMFQKETNLAGWKQKLEGLESEKEKLSDDNILYRKRNSDIIKNAEKRINDVIDMKNFFLKEREELKKFIKEVENKEILEEMQRKEKEHKEFVKKQAKVDKEPIIPNEDYSAKELLDSINGNRKAAYSGSSKEKSGEGRIKAFFPKFILLIAAIVLVALIIFGIWFLKPDINISFGNRSDKIVMSDKSDDNINDNPDGKKKSDNTDEKSGKTDDKSEKTNKSDNTTTTTQEEFMNGMKQKYDADKDMPDKQSYFYNFYMTLMDKWRLTNIVAVKSGYSKMLFPFEKRNAKGRDPDWIYPGNILSMPDDTKVNVAKGDTMWGICETYLVNEINRDEIEIRALIEKTKTKELTVAGAKKQLENIKDDSHSEMVVEFINTLLVQKNFREWEPKDMENKKP